MHGLMENSLHLWRGSRLTKRIVFGSLEWDAIRKTTIMNLPRHGAVAAWKHSRPSFVQQDGVESIPKGRGAEHGDVDGPLEASLLLGELGGQARRCIHEAQRCGDLPWSSVASVSFNGARLDYDERLQKKTSWAAQSPPEKQVSGPGGSLNVNPDNEVQTNGGIADFWYLDDGDILCDPRLA